MSRPNLVVESGANPSYSGFVPDFFAIISGGD